MTVRVIPITDDYRENWERIFMRGNSTAEERPHKPCADGSTPSPAINERQESGRFPVGFIGPVIWDLTGCMEGF